jgi:hypothetical protein
MPFFPILLQVKQNAAMRSCLRFRREDHEGGKKLQQMTNLPSIEELSLKANCMMAWRTFTEHGDLKDLAVSRLKLQAHGRATRSVAAVKLV